MLIKRTLSAGKRLKELKLSTFFFLTIAGVINAFGVTIFLYPVKLYDSGISGTSMLLDQVTPEHYELSLFLLLLNVPIFLFGLKKQGFSFTVYSIYTIAVYSFMSYMIMEVLPINVEFVSPLAGSDLLLCAIFGGVISGIGSGLTIRFGGAIDDVDVLSVTFAKTLGLSLGTFVMIYNTILYVICGIVIQSWILPLYSIVTYFVGSKTVDFIAPLPQLSVQRHYSQCNRRFFKRQQTDPVFYCQPVPAQQVEEDRSGNRQPSIYVLAGCLRYHQEERTPIKRSRPVNVIRKNDIAQGSFFD